MPSCSMTGSETAPSGLGSSPSTGGAWGSRAMLFASSTRAAWVSASVVDRAPSADDASLGGAFSSGVGVLMACPLVGVAHRPPARHGRTRVCRSRRRMPPIGTGPGQAWQYPPGYAAPRSAQRPPPARRRDGKRAAVTGRDGALTGRLTRLPDPAPDGPPNGGSSTSDRILRLPQLCALTCTDTGRSGRAQHRCRPRRQRTGSRMAYQRRPAHTDP